MNGAEASAADLQVVREAEDDALPMRLLPAGVRGAVRHMGPHGVGEMAGGIAFRVFLSIFPALIAAVAILGLVMSPDDINRLAADAPAVIPDEAVELLRRPLERLTAEAGAGAGALAVTGVLGGLWAATTAATTLIKALDRINGITQPRPFLAQRAVALLLTVVLFVAIALILALLVFGPQLQRLLLGDALATGPARYLAGVAQVTVVVTVLFTLFSLIYWLGPNRDGRGRWRWSTPGGVVGVAGWLLLAGGFTLYVQTAGNYEATYGALAGVVVLLVWLQLSSTILLFGAEVDAEVRRLVGREAVVADAVGMDPLAPVAADLPRQYAVPPHPRPSAGLRAAREGAVLAGVAAGVATLLRVLRRRSMR